MRITEAEDTDLVSLQVLFNDHFLAGGAEFPVQHDFFQSRVCLLFCLWYYDAFASCQTICFDHYIVVYRVQICLGCIIVVEILIGRGGYVVFFHEIFGKRL